MALTVGFHQTALHNTSHDALFAICQAKRWQCSIPVDQEQNPTTSREPRLEQDVIPAPKIFQTFLKPSSSSSSSSSISREEIDSIPSVGECATHLLLLEVFHSLRAKTIQSRELDSLFEIAPNPRKVYRNVHTGLGRQVEAVKLKDTTFADKRKEKWVFFLRLAAVRFEIWLEKANLVIGDLPVESGGDRVARVLASLLPPLGTSMVSV